MKYKSQSGSAHIVVIVLLVIALLGALGFVFYQNFILKKSEQPASSTVNQSVEDKTDTAQLAFHNDIYELDYPNAWKAAITKDESGGGTIIITNPNTTIRTTMTVSGGGLGGACDTNDGLKVRYHTVHPATAKELTGDPLYIVEAMTDLAEGGYHYVIGLVPDGGETHATVGDSHCTVGYIGVASSVIINDGVVTRPLIIAKIDFPELPKAEEMQQVKDLMATDDYKKALKVLGSARKK